MTEQAMGGSSAEWLQDLLLDSDDIGDFLNEFARATAESLSAGGDEVWCAVTLLRDRRAGTVAASGERAAALDEIQYEFGDGPCLTAAREHRLVHIPDVRHSDMWPDYTAAAARVGVRSVVGVPFDLAGEAQAGFNVYSGRPGRFDAGTIGTLQYEVRSASKALRLALRLARHRDAAADLDAAMRSRTTIDLAVGIVMGQNRCSQEEAFGILASASSNRNVKLRDLAAELVATVGKGPAETHFDR